LVFDVKSDGWFHLMHAIGDMPLGAVVAFSSIAGRFGNAGQADYSAANDLLCKFVSSFRSTRPTTRGIVIDWTAWAGIGMAARGSIPKMMELAGIDMLPPDAGIPWIRRELTAGARCGEVVAGDRLGVLLSECDAAGGLDTAALPSDAAGPMTGEATGMGVHRGLTIETTLDPRVQPFLYDHQIEGTPVLPGVMGIEAFAEAALRVLPGWYVEAVEDVNFLAPFKFYKSEPRTVTIEAEFHPEGDAVIADCRLSGRRMLPNQAEPQVTTHFTARVRLTQAAPVAVDGRLPGVSDGPAVEAVGIYRLYFHGPAYQVVERAWRDGDRIAGQLAGGLPANHHPPERPLTMAPRWIELCFQTAGLWEIGVLGRMGLPRHLDRVSVWSSPDVEEGPLFAVVTPSPDGGAFDADVVDSAGRCCARVSGYRTVTFRENIATETFEALREWSAMMAMADD
jgi:hypothetical protein